MRRSAGSVVAAAMAVAACSAERRMDQPPPPPGFAQPAEYPLGDAAAAAEQRALGHAVRALASRYGHPKVAWLTGRHPIDGAAVRRHYDEWFAGRGVGPTTVDAGPDAAAVGYETGRDAFVVILPRTGEVVTTLALTAR